HNRRSARESSYLAPHLLLYRAETGCPGPREHKRRRAHGHDAWERGHGDRYVLRTRDWSGYSNYSTMPHLLPFESEVDATWRQPFMELNLLQSNAARARDPIHTARVMETSACVHRTGSSAHSPERAGAQVVAGGPAQAGGRTGGRPASARLSGEWST